MFKEKKTLKFKLNEKVTIYPEEVAESHVATFPKYKKVEKLQL